MMLRIERTSCGHVGVVSTSNATASRCGLRSAPCALYGLASDPRLDRVPPLRGTQVARASRVLAVPQRARPLATATPHVESRIADYELVRSTCRAGVLIRLARECEIRRDTTRHNLTGVH
jgi:hypothetical protein